VPVADRAGASDLPAGAPPAAEAHRVRGLGLGFIAEPEPPAGLSRAGAIPIEFLFFPNVQIPESATTGHTEPVAAGSQ
jgi:hypothetical protein